VSTIGAKSAQKALHWRGPTRRKEQKNGQESIQIMKFLKILPHGPFLLPAKQRQLAKEQCFLSLLW